MTTVLSRIVSQGAVAALVAVIAVSTHARPASTARAAAQSATVTIADLDPLCGHHYPKT